MIYNLIGFILAISILVFVHEFGHYYVAKRCGIKILEFSLGFGKEIYAYIDKSGVRWKLCLIPLGGFVKMYGDVDYSSMESIVPIEEKQKSFVFQPFWVKFLVVLAGPLANYLLAILIFAVFYNVYGKLEIPAIINQVIEASPAKKAGLLSGDRVISINGNDINSFLQLQEYVILNYNSQLKFQVVRDNKIINLSITPEVKSEKESGVNAKIGYIGVQSAENAGTYVKLDIISSFGHALSKVIDVSILTFKVIMQMLFGQRSIDELHGPIAVASASGSSMSQGLVSFISFIAILSINIGFFNLLPIPLLDGGHLVIFTYEFITQKALNTKTKNILIKFGMMIIMFLIVISTSNDIKSLIF